jgi:hypothetical protein
VGFWNNILFVCNVSYVSDDWLQAHDEWKKVRSGPSVWKVFGAWSAKNHSKFPSPTTLNMIFSV